MAGEGQASCTDEGGSSDEGDARAPDDEREAEQVAVHPDRPNGSRPDQFSREWAAVRHDVWRFCRASTRGRADAEDLFQIVASRAWRGYSTFTGESAFATWVRAICRNELARYVAGVTRRQESSIDAASAVAIAAEIAAHRQDERLAGAEHEPVLDRLGRQWLRTALGRLLEDAVESRALSAVEAEVLRVRAASDDDVDWAELAPRWGLTPAHCAVLHFRGKEKLRVFLLCTRPELLGGPEALRAAFEAARSGTSPLTDAEAEAFEAVVLQGRTDYRRRGWARHLRRAVERVARHTRLVEW